MPGGQGPPGTKDLTTMMMMMMMMIADVYIYIYIYIYIYVHAYTQVYYIHLPFGSSVCVHIAGTVSSL